MLLYRGPFIHTVGRPLAEPGSHESCRGRVHTNLAGVGGSKHQSFGRQTTHCATPVAGRQRPEGAVGRKDATMPNHNPDEGERGDSNAGISFEADRRTALKGLGAAGVGLGLGALASGSASADNPADKVGVAGSTMTVLEVATTDTENHSATHTLLSGTLKSSSPTDLLIQPTAETALWTTVATVGNDSSRARARITCWIELDGKRVLVSSDYKKTGLSRKQASEVVFDKRAHRMETMQFDDEDARIEHFLKTRSANGFNWITLDVGNGNHTLEFKGRLDVNVDDPNAEAKAIVGPRTLIVEPVKLANHASR